MSRPTFRLPLLAVPLAWAFTPLPANSADAAPAPANPPENKKAEGARPSAEEILKKLQQPVPSLDKPIEGAPLRDMLEFLADRCNLLILVDQPAFTARAKRAGKDKYNVEEDVSIKLPRMIGLPLDQILRQLLKQVDATYVVRSGFIEITTPEAARVPNFSATVRAAFNKRPLAEVLDELSERFDRTILVAPQAGDKAKIPVTAKLLGVPFETAVDLLAEMADLKVVRRDNVLFVTTPEHAARMQSQVAAKAEPKPPIGCERPEGKPQGEPKPQPLGCGKPEGQPEGQPKPQPR